MLEIMFLKKVNRMRFDVLQTHFYNQYSKVLSQYPQDLSGAYYTITSHRLTVTTMSKITETSCLSLLQTSTHQSNNVQGQISPQEQIANFVGKDGKLHAYLSCYDCNSFGHYASHFPGEAHAATTLAGFL